MTSQPCVAAFVGARIEAIDIGNLYLVIEHERLQLVLEDALSMLRSLHPSPMQWSRAHAGAGNAAYLDRRSTAQHRWSGGMAGPSVSSGAFRLRAWASGRRH